MDPGSTNSVEIEIVKACNIKNPYLYILRYTFIYICIFIYSCIHLNTALRQCLKSIPARDARKMLCDSGTSWRKRNPSSKTNIALKMNVARHFLSCFDGLVSWWFCAPQWVKFATMTLAKPHCWPGARTPRFSWPCWWCALSLEGGGVFFLTNDGILSDVGEVRGFLAFLTHRLASQMANMQECQV